MEEIAEEYVCPYCKEHSCFCDGTHIVCRICFEEIDDLLQSSL